MPGLKMIEIVHQPRDQPYLFWFRIKVAELYSHNWMINSVLKIDCDVDFLSVYFNIKIFSLILLIQEW